MYSLVLSIQYNLPIVIYFNIYQTHNSPPWPGGENGTPKLVRIKITADPVDIKIIPPHASYILTSQSYLFLYFPFDCSLIVLSNSTYFEPRLLLHGTVEKIAPPS